MNRHHVKHEAKDWLNIYIPRKLRAALAWLVVSAIIGIWIQSAIASQFVFGEFFYKNFVLWLKTLSELLDASVIFGYGPFFSYLINNFYYITGAISLVMIVFHLITTIQERNTRRIIFLLGVIGLLAFLIVEYGGDYSFDFLSTCEQKASKLVPENLTLYFDVTYKLIKEDNNWNDGQIIVDSLDEEYSVGFLPGESSGQNVNYYYLEPASFLVSQPGLTYSQRIISNEGDILGTNSFRIVPVLDLLDETHFMFSGLPKYYYFGGETDAYLFDIVDYEIVSCNWVE